MADTTPLETITFGPWIDPVVDYWGIDPTSRYSRTGWLPIIGPSAWLIWGTVATQLKDEQSVTWQLEDLAEAHGLGPRVSRTSPIVRTLTRLTQFGMTRPVEHGHLLIRTTVPPLSRRQLKRLPTFVQQLHTELYYNTYTRQANAE